MQHTFLDFIKKTIHDHDLLAILREIFVCFYTESKIGANGFKHKKRFKVN